MHDAVEWMSSALIRWWEQWEPTAEQTTAAAEKASVTDLITALQECVKRNPRVTMKSEGVGKVFTSQTEVLSLFLYNSGLMQEALIRSRALLPCSQSRSACDVKTRKWLFSGVRGIFHVAVKLVDYGEEVDVSLGNWTLSLEKSDTDDCPQRSTSSFSYSVHL